MALLVVGSIVLGPLALLLADLVRGTSRIAPAAAASFDADGHRIRAPRPSWPTPATRDQRA